MKTKVEIYILWLKMVYGIFCIGFDYIAVGFCLIANCLNAADKLGKRVDCWQEWIHYLSNQFNLLTEEES